MADEKLRVTTFDTVALDDGDWDGPQHLGELLTYKSKHAAASIKVTRARWSSSTRTMMAAKR
jgi:hypothetical protein